MLEIEVKDLKNNAKGKITLNNEVFNNQSDPSIVHSATLSYLANQRQGNAATKTRAFVSGGGKKPWKQKHTGRSRHGSTRSPIWRGGGVTFGPQPRDYYTKLPKKAKKNALYKALSMKLQDSQLLVIDSIKIEKPRTKDIINLIGTLGLNGKTVLIVTAQLDRNLLMSARNIPTVDAVVAKDLNAYQVALYDCLIFTEDAIKEIQTIGTHSDSEVTVQ